MKSNFMTFMNFIIFNLCFFRYFVYFQIVNLNNSVMLCITSSHDFVMV